MKYNILLIIFLLLILFTGCSSQSIQQKKDTPLHSLHDASDEMNQDIKNEPIKQSTTNLFTGNDQIQNEITLTIEGVEYPARFVEIKHTPYGLYIPDTFEILEFEDGREVGINKAEKISIREEIPPAYKNISKIDKDLSGYKEYLGSIIDENGVRNDFFQYSYKQGSEAIVEFRYFDKNKNEILPVFLEVAKHITYID